MRAFPAGEPTCPALRMAEDGGEGGGGKLWQRISHSLGLKRNYLFQAFGKRR